MRTGIRWGSVAITDHAHSVTELIRAALAKRPRDKAAAVREIVVNALEDAYRAGHSAGAAESEADLHSTVARLVAKAVESIHVGKAHCPHCRGSGCDECGGSGLWSEHMRLV